MKKNFETKDLYTTSEVKKVREQLFKEQQGKCAISGLTFDIKDCHLDHAHDNEQLVRGVLYKQSNMLLGKLESLWVRYLAYWYPGTLTEFLKQAVAYLEQSKDAPDTRWRHPGWQAKLRVSFNKLNTKQQNGLLMLFLGTTGKNPAERKKLWSKVILDRELGYKTILEAINQTKGTT